MEEDVLKLVGYDEGGLQDNAGRKRLVCNLEGGGKVAIWGSTGDTANIDAVLAAGVPCEVRCRWPVPASWAQRNVRSHALDPQ